MSDTANRNRPHSGQPIYTAGEHLSNAWAAMVLVHGRGASASDILLLGEELYHPQFAYLAPQAAGNTWYPYSFLAPIQQNEPWLTSALEAVDAVVQKVEDAGIDADRIIVGGFSQGACLASEFVARHPRRYGGLLMFSGGLIGPPGGLRTYTGDLAGTPVFLGCSDVDPHIPKERVLESARILEELGGDVTYRLYPGLGHTVNRDEIDRARAIVRAVVTASSAAG
ncbi:MAG: hypothetical protein R2844_17945 [Caldilineales bacterium]